MRFPPNWSMELILIVGLFFTVVVVIFSVQDPRTDRTRFTLERGDAAHVGELRPAITDEPVIGR